MLYFKMFKFQQQQQVLLLLTVKHKKQFKDQIFVLLVIKDLYCFKAGYVYQKLIIVSSTETANVIFVSMVMSSITMFVLKSQRIVNNTIKQESAHNVQKDFTLSRINAEKYLNKFFGLSSLQRNT